MSQQSSSKGGQRNQANSSAQSGRNTAAGTAREVGDQAKQTVGQVANQAQQAAGQVADQARQQVSSRLSGQKDRAAEGLTSVAQALRQTGQQLREQDQMGVTSYIDRAASQVERLSGYIQHNDLGQLVDDVEQLARRQPAVFLGASFVLGLLGARFLKSSRPYTGPAGGTALARRQSGYYAGYSSGAGIRAGTTGPNYGSTTTPGMYTTPGSSASGQYGSGTTSGTALGGSTSEQSASYGAGTRSPESRPEE